MNKQRVLRIRTATPSRAEHAPVAPGIWSGTISFSLVAIPVHMVLALRPSRVSFRLLHSKDNSPLLRRMFCPKHEAIVPPEDIVRGYEIAHDKYVTVTDEELESVAPERSRTIEILQFVDIAEVDSVYFGHPYYLLPSEGGEKAYKLLVELMHRTNKAGIAKFVLEEREHVAVVRSERGMLSLITLHYSEDVVPDGEIAPKDDKLDSREKASIESVIRRMTSDFKPGKYADERRKAIMKLLEKWAKQRGMVEAPEIEEEETAGGAKGPVDLVAVLERSMRKVKKKR